MKRKMSNRKFKAIMIPVICFLVILGMGITGAAEHFAPSLDNYLGRGERYIVGGANYAQEDTDYYNQIFPLSQQGKIDSSHAAYLVAEELSDEGEVLLKNDGVLPLAQDDKATSMGYRYINPIMTGTGSGAATLLQDFVIRPKDAITKYFSLNEKMDSVLNAADPVYATAKGYKTAADNNGTFSGATASVGEFSPDIYNPGDIGDYKTALVFIGRQGGEGGDLQMTPYYDNSGKAIAFHHLQSMPYKKEMLTFAKVTCEKVIVIINSPNPMELGELQDDSDVNAILWVGTTGSRGFESMGKILCGQINPSGRLVDTYYRDFMADPTFNNYGMFYYSNDSEFTHRDAEGGEAAHFVEYEEGIYIGYKYYETRFTDETEYAKAVVYPFGYGLSYNSQVSQTLHSVTYDESSGTVTVKGVVVNESPTWDVKEVVQIYFDPHYDAEGSGIEKASKNLVAFTKVSAAKNSSQDFELTFSVEDMASYDHKGYYTNGAGSYVLEQGDYGICLGKNAHDSWAQDSIHIDKTVVYYDGAALSAPVDGCDYVGKRSSDLETATNQYGFVGEEKASTPASRTFINLSLFGSFCPD